MESDYLLKTVPALGVLVTIIALYYQIWRSRFSMNLDLVLKMDDKFNSSTFKELRTKVSNAVLNPEAVNKFIDAEEVFDFFETLGYFVKHKALDKKIVWHTFYIWVHAYWSLGKDHILLMQKEYNDDTLWEDFNWLHNALLKVERSETNKPEPEILSEKEIEEFFKFEP
jgi:hypothetical protein